MPPPIYLDECINRHLAPLLRARDVDVTTALSAGTPGFDDRSQRLFATQQNRIIVTHNQRHFQRLHELFVAAQRPHSGIMLVPNGVLALVNLRVSLLITWIESWESVENRLIRWHDLQGELICGLRLDGFTEVEVRQALAIDPMPPG